MYDQKKQRSRQNSPVASPLRTSSRAHAHLLPTLFDRLSDDAPQQQVETAKDYALTHKQIADIVRRDLTYLLSTTNMEELIDRHRHEAAATSTINFGMPALSGSYLSTRNWIDIEQLIHRAIVDFEPRLAPHSLKIVPLHEAPHARQYNVLLFEISGMIHLEPYPMPFLMQSTVDLETSRVHVTPVSGR